mgnify:CR=1 FL=1
MEVVLEATYVRDPVFSWIPDLLTFSRIDDWTLSKITLILDLPGAIFTSYNSGFCTTTEDKSS